MMRPLIVFTVLAVFLTACASAPWRQSAPEPVVGPDPLSSDEGLYETTSISEPILPLSVGLRFSHVPVPEGAELDLDRTYVYESASLQIGKMVYSIKASVHELIEFYVNECPAAGWNQVSRIDAAGAELVYVRAGQRLAVSIQPTGIARAKLLILHLTPELTL